ncbi:MAG: CvpA family protein [Bacilli bacterium]
MKNNIVLRILVTLVVAFLVFYITLPPINFQYFGFYVYLVFVILVFKVTGIINIKTNVKRIFKEGYNKNKFYKDNLIYFVIAGVFVLICLVNIIFSPLFMSKKYSNRIEIDESNDFTSEINEVNFDMIPLLDKDSSTKLGDRVMGQMSELVSQFEVSSLYTQINYNNEIIRVTPLEYANGIKWLTNRKDGVKGYIKVNSVTGKSELIKLDKGMKYMPSSLFNENLYRKLRFLYPTKVFGNVSFEIDNEGNPYWIVPTIRYSAVGLLKEVDGIIIFDPITAKSTYYDTNEVPKWVDQVYSANLVIEQVNDWGMYKNGFLNSLFGQKGVVTTTDGYNYMIQDDDVYLYTGITSINSDESNIGFIITNLRTKETKFYNVPGAEEYSAMDSAKGQVQQMNYNSTFPLLINLNDRPTYLISLKDKAGLVKMYAFVDVEDYQKVVVTDASLGVEEAARNYLSSVDLKNSGSTLIEKTIVIDKINSATIDSMTYYYITDTEKQKYKVSIKVSDYLPFVSKGDELKISYVKQKDIIEITNINN